MSLTLIPMLMICFGLALNGLLDGLEEDDVPPATVRVESS